MSNGDFVGAIDFVNNLQNLGVYMELMSLNKIYDIFRLDFFYYENNLLQNHLLNMIECHCNHDKK